MNILKKALAPLTDKAWDEVSEQADRITKEYLTGRKFAYHRAGHLHWL